LGIVEKLFVARIRAFSSAHTPNPSNSTDVTLAEQEQMQGEPMRHDDQMDTDERKAFHHVYGVAADSVSASVDMFLATLDEFMNACYDDPRELHSMPIMLMFDFAEAVDGVAVLVRSGSAKNCSQLLRTAFEIQLGIKYMIESLETYSMRSLAYEYFHWLENWKWEQRIDPDSDIGKQIRRECADHPHLDVFDFKGRKPLGPELKATMDSDKFKEIRAELADMKANKRRGDNWYSLWNGPANLRSLAYHLKQGPLYEGLFRAWSSVTHGEGALKRIKGGRQGEVLVSPIRSPEGLTNACRTANFICKELWNDVARELTQPVKERLGQMYEQHVKPCHKLLEQLPPRRF
jgi:hypothetical protein